METLFDMIFFRLGNSSTCRDFKDLGFLKRERVITMFQQLKWFETKPMQFNNKNV